MSREPILGKRPPDPRDYTPIKWSDFLKIRRAAQIAADNIGYPVYLVGSALKKDIPRDIDITIRIPEADYLARFGPIPKDQSDYNAYFYNVWSKTFDQISSLHYCLIDTHRMDIKVFPDTWFANDDTQWCLAIPRKDAKGVTHD